LIPPRIVARIGVHRAASRAACHEQVKRLLSARGVTGKHCGDPAFVSAYGSIEVAHVGLPQPLANGTGEVALGEGSEPH
jgi:hypothetical protein